MRHEQGARRGEQGRLGEGRRKLRSRRRKEDLDAHTHARTRTHARAHTFILDLVYHQLAANTPTHKAVPATKAPPMVLEAPDEVLKNFCAR